MTGSDLMVTLRRIVRNELSAAPSKCIDHDTEGEAV